MSAPNQHAFTGHILHWLYCEKCGLILLKNVRTEKAARKPCKGTE